jgi:micrococcal nuclease
MLKKISLTLSILLLVFVTACETTPEVTDTDIVYQVKNELSFDTLEVSEDIIIPTSVNEDVQLEWTSSRPEYLTTEGVVTRPGAGEGNKTVSLTVVITLNEAVATKSFDITVLQEPSAFDTRFTDDLAIDFVYEGQEFIANGVGEVDLVACVDGDTAIFTEGSGHFSVRFLGINTPESTYKFEPWGKPASEFTCEKLENATTIVLEADASTTRTDGNERYLAWVWYDGRLLNLELVEEAYTGSKGVGGMKYESVFYQAEFKTQDTDKRIWGEDDPTFDYSLDGVQITIEELVTNQEDYVGQKVVITGVVSRTLAGHPYIQQGDYGIYLFKGYDFTTKLAEGNEVLISGLTLTYYPDSETGAAQLTGFTRENIEVLSSDNVVNPVLQTIDGLSRDSIGSLIQLNGLTVISIYENTYDDAFTVTAEDSAGNEITIRRDDAASSAITADLFEVGVEFNIVAPLGRYSGNYQLVITDVDDITIITNNN